MKGLEKNIARLFGNKGKLFLVALDHPQYFGPLEGLEDPCELMVKLRDSPIDGFVVNPGVAKVIEMDIVREKKLVIRANTGGNKFFQGRARFPVVLSPKHALDLGADAVILMMTIGCEGDLENLEEVSKAINRFHSFSLPVIVEVFPPDPRRAPLSDLVGTGARIAAEVGADVVKVPYTPEFQKVVSGCPVPVVLAGGPKDVDFFKAIQDGLKAGARGLIIGRNIFQAEDPLEVLSKLEYMLRG